MNQIQSAVEIHSTKQKVWDTLWQDETFRQWAGIIDPGTYMKGELLEGNEVQFISGNGYGVTSLVEKVVVGEFLHLRHSADTQESGQQDREKEWAGGEEIYSLTEKDGVTTLNVVFDVPPDMEEYFQDNYPKALQTVKDLAEGQ